jgi:hypothetical protein
MCCDEHEMLCKKQTSISENYVQATDLLSKKAKQLDALMTAARVRQLMVNNSSDTARVWLITHRLYQIFE